MADDAEPKDRVGFKRAEMFSEPLYGEGCAAPGTFTVAIASPPLRRLKAAVDCPGPMQQLCIARAIVRMRHSHYSAGTVKPYATHIFVAFGASLPTVSPRARRSLRSRGPIGIRSAARAPPHASSRSRSRALACPQKASQWAGKLETAEGPLKALTDAVEAKADALKAAAGKVKITARRRRRCSPLLPQPAGAICV